MIKIKYNSSITITIFVLLFSSFVHSEQQKILNIYGWGGNYFPNEILAQFTKETGIKVNLSEYANNETMYAKLKASGSKACYDVVAPSTYYVERMSKQGMLQPLDKSKFTNLSDINALALNQKFDPKNTYSIPYLWGTTGIIINKKYINKKTITKWQDLWDPKYRNQLMMIDDMRDVFSLSLLSLGYSPNDNNPDHIKEAYIKLTKLLPNIKIFNIDTIPNIYIDEDALIGVAWGGDCKLAQKENSNIQYIYPKEGFTIWIDSFTVIKNSPNLENAYKFINFMLRSDIAKQITLINGFATPNKIAMKLLPQKIQLDPILNPDDNTMKRGTIQLDPPNEIYSLYEKYWEKLKIGN